MVFLCLSILTVLLLFWWRRKHMYSLDFPGPSGLPIVGSYFSMRGKPMHELLYDWGIQYGGAFTFSVFGKHYLVISDPDTLQEALVTRGNAFAGRPESYPMAVVTDNYQTVVDSNNVSFHRALRKVMHSVVKAYGTGRAELSPVLDTAVDNLLQLLADTRGEPFDPRESVYEAAAWTVFLVVCGNPNLCEGSLVARTVSDLNNAIADATFPTWGNTALDLAPFLRYLPWCFPYNKLLQQRQTIEAIGDQIIEPILHHCSQSEGPALTLGGRLLDVLGQGYVEGVEARCITMTTVKHIIQEAFAGTDAIATSLYAMFNILQCHPEIQENAHAEITNHVTPGDRVRLKDKNELHYCRAILYELLRYTSVAPLGVSRVTREDTRLSGVHVRKGTEVIPNLWACHHDPRLWPDPWTFNPERFLDERGQLLTADHRNMKQLFPFGAGVRVCVGEALAINRIFLFLANVVMRFKLLPPDGAVNCDPRKYTFGAVVEPPSYTTTFMARDCARTPIPSQTSAVVQRGSVLVLLAASGYLMYCMLTIRAHGHPSLPARSVHSMPGPASTVMPSTTTHPTRRGVIGATARHDINRPALNGVTAHKPTRHGVDPDRTPGHDIIIPAQSAHNNVNLPSAHSVVKPTPKPAAKQPAKQQQGNANANHPLWYDDIRRMDNPFTRQENCKHDFNYQTMAEALAAHASPDKVIVLTSTVDLGYLPMAFNFYEFNIHRLNITNYLFMCINKAACDALKKHCISAYLFTEAPDSDRAHPFGDIRFAHKCHMKLTFVQESLRLGYNVLLTDLDIVFLKNPLPYLQCPDCDVLVQTNSITKGKSSYNAGFTFVKNNKFTTEAYKRAVDIVTADTNADEQRVLNKVFKSLEDDNKLKVVSLPMKTFPSGLYWPVYFTDDIVILHNNFITGLVQKIDRFKEHLMWVSDQDRYYSDPHRKYLTYNNPALFDGETALREKQALCSALGISMVLNRTLILPRFYCNKHVCSIGAAVASRLLHRAFHGHYRENSFLGNPRIPQDLTSSPIVIIQSAIALNSINVTDEVAQFQPRDADQGASAQELKEWFLPFTEYRILRFHSMYGAFSGFQNETVQNAFKQALSQMGWSWKSLCQ